MPRASNSSHMERLKGSDLALFWSQKPLPSPHPPLKNYRIVVIWELMIVSFGNRLAKDLVEEIQSKEVRGFPAELIRICRRKLNMIHAATTPEDLKIPRGNRLEALKGSRKGEYSIRVNDQWRITFRFDQGNALEVKVEDYHK